MKVFFPDAIRLEKLGFGPVANAPVLFDSRHVLARIPSRYLRERALGRWSPQASYEGPHLSSRVRPTRSTLAAAAWQISIFLDWCEDRGQHWRTVAYDDVLTFQNEMILGKWSKTGRRLQPSTANNRADEATSFLAWASWRGLRDSFPVPHTTRQRSVGGGRSSTGGTTLVRSRVGQAKTSRTREIVKVVAVPQPAEVRDWLLLVREVRGISKYLASKFILETGTRLEETISLDASQIPSAEAIADLRSRGRTAGYIDLVKTKGGRPRTIQVSLSFLEELRNWIDGRRLTLLLRYHKRTGKRPSDRLFVSDATGFEGIPIARHTLYDVFHEVRPAPAKWHPHFGRHTYACHWMFAALNLDAASERKSLRELGIEWIFARGGVYLRLLSKQLGHLDEMTTEIYLRWLATAVGIEEVAENWHRFLSSDADQAS